MSDAPFDFTSEAEATNQVLAGAVVALQALSPADVVKIAPDPGDQAKIQQLIASVNAATSQNDKIAALQQNLSQLGGLATKLMGVLR